MVGSDIIMRPDIYSRLQALTGGKAVEFRDIRTQQIDGEDESPAKRA
jgi:hypothetical protein